MLKSLMAKANKVASSDFIIRPVEVDRKALGDMKGKRKVGESVDGLGGFILEAGDGSVSYDMRSDTLLDTAWGQSLSCLLYTSPSPRDIRRSRMPSSA